MSLLFSLFHFKLYLSFEQVGKNWKNKRVTSLVLKNVQRSYVLNVYSFFGRVTYTNSHLSHWTPCYPASCNIHVIKVGSASFRTTIPCEIYIHPIMVSQKKIKNKFTYLHHIKRNKETCSITMILHSIYRPGIREFSIVVRWILEECIRKNVAGNISLGPWANKHARVHARAHTRITIYKE